MRGAGQAAFARLSAIAFAKVLIHYRGNGGVDDDCRNHQIGEET
jgi:hypothetical protein